MVLQRTSISLAIPTNWSNFFSHLASYPPRYRSWHESRWSREEDDGGGIAGAEKQEKRARGAGEEGAVTGSVGLEKRRMTKMMQLQGSRRRGC
jgi:hypothetical protein